MLSKLKKALAARARRKKFEKMKEQLDPPPKRKPAMKSVPRK